FRDQKTLASEDYLKGLASVIDKHPGWRFELIVVAPKRSMLGLSGAKILSPEDIQQYISTARALLQNRQIHPAQIIAWAALEATLRSVAQQNGLHIDRPAVDYLIKTLYSVGLLTRSDFEVLQRGLLTRNRLVHGFQPLASEVREVETIELELREAEKLIEIIEAQLAKVTVI